MNARQMMIAIGKTLGEHEVIEIQVTSARGRTFVEHYAVTREKIRYLHHSWNGTGTVRAEYEERVVKPRKSAIAAGTSMMEHVELTTVHLLPETSHRINKLVRNLGASEFIRGLVDRELDRLEQESSCASEGALIDFEIESNLSKLLIAKTTGRGQSPNSKKGGMKPIIPQFILQKCKSVYELGYSQKETAALLGVSLYTVRKATVPNFAENNRQRQRRVSKERYAIRQKNPSYIEYQKKYHSRPERLEIARKNMEKLRVLRR